MQPPPMTFSIIQITNPPRSARGSNRSAYSFSHNIGQTEQGVQRVFSRQTSFSTSQKPKKASFLHPPTNLRRPRQSNVEHHSKLEDGDDDGGRSGGKTTDKWHRMVYNSCSPLRRPAAGRSRINRQSPQPKVQMRDAR